MRLPKGRAKNPDGGAWPFPVAVVIFSGLISSTLLDTLLTPLVYLSSTNPLETWATVLGESSLMCALNQDLCKLDAVIEDFDEIAFFPQVTGG